MQDRLLVTGFGPFLDVADNPSGRLAESCGRRAEVLEVSFGAVDGFLDSLDPGSFDTWLALGANTRASVMQYETVGRNAICGLPDVRDEVHGPGPIDPAGPALLSSSLWHGGWAEREGVEASVHAGAYLCNYLLYCALRRFPEKRIGFLHVPPVAHMSLERQEATLAGLIEGIG